MRIIDGDELRSELIRGHDLIGAKYVDLAPTIKTKQIKYYDEDENVWKIGELIVNSSEKPNNCETCRFELYCPEMCEGCCEWDSHYEPKDEPHAEIPEYAEWKEPFEKMTDCPWK